ncbi:MAG: hypothetical protein HQK65_07350 [Desulfamplus sp.]|nr:hypothetical protein [Desulfamplus sp.]
MHCLWCEHDFEPSIEYSNLQEMMAIPIGDPTFSEQQVINGTLCLSCHKHYSKMSWLGPVCLKCGRFLYFSNTVDPDERRSEKYYQWARKNYRNKANPMEIKRLSLFKEREKNGLSQNIYETAVAHEVMCFRCLDRHYRKTRKPIRRVFRRIHVEPDYSDSAQAREQDIKMRKRMMDRRKAEASITLLNKIEEVTI